MMVDEFNNGITPLIDAEALYNDAPCGYLSFMPDGTIIKINKTLLNLLEYTAEEVLFQKKFNDFLSIGGNVHFEMFFRPMLNLGGAVKELNYELISKSNKIIPVLFGAVTIRDAEKNMLAINAILTDNTERNHFEKELLASKIKVESEKKSLEFLADLIPEMIWTADCAGNIDYVNFRFIEYFQLSGKAFNLPLVFKKIFPADRKKFLVSWREHMGSGSQLNFELRLENNCFDFEWHEVKAIPYLNENGELIKWFGSCTNIDAHIKANKKKDEFIGVASHELKTPITSLMGALQLIDRLKDQPTSPTFTKLIQQANKNIKRVHTLVNELLNVSQMNEGQLHLNKSEVKLSEIIHECCAYIKREKKINVSIVGNSKLNVFIDQVRIEQVLINFLNNAVKYAPESKKLIISVTKLENEIEVAVTDFGRGIEPEKIKHLFDRYYRVNREGTNSEGLGLGLYICGQIIEKHKGRYGAQSKLGEGSTFWFTIPI